MQTDQKQLPKHLAIIMDGNRRYARQNLMSDNEGHQAGIENLKKVVKLVKEKGIKYLTVYAFSLDNQGRATAEVNYLFSAAKREFAKLKKGAIDRCENIRIIGEETNLPNDIISIIKEVNEVPWIDDAFTLFIAFNYRSDAEIASACNRALANGEEVTPEAIAKYLYTSPAPMVDLLIRTSGEQRLSGFLLYQASYAELYFTSCYWPCFDEIELDKALDAYCNRHRRFGKD